MASTQRARRKRPSSLTEYRRKRDFSVTAEPAGDDGAAARGTLAFVIQKHAASHLHFDLRLELDGVMKSWAVPKGPSRDPAVKRLAMQVEDHPISYNAFEGTIPKGEYGGGTVMIWDRGTYTSPDGDEDGIRAALEKGRLRFTLHGERLEGSWAIVRMHGDAKREWLLIKHGDEFVVPGDEFAAEDARSVVTGRTLDEIGSDTTPKPTTKKAARKRAPAKDAPARTAVAPPPADRALSPMLASVATGVPTGKQWAFEPKYDGIRVLAFVSGEAVGLYTRNQREKSAQFPEVTESLRALSKRTKRPFVLDGEIVARRGRTLGRFQALQERIGQTNAGTIDRHVQRSPAVFVAFDVLLAGDETLAEEPWSVRRAELEELLTPPLGPGLRLGEATRGSGERLLARAKRAGWEGIMAKLASSAYLPGVRSRDWQKIKIEGRQEFVVGGWTEPRRSRTHIGSLLIGYWKGKSFEYAGHVGGGFTQAGLHDMYALLEPLERKTSPFSTEPDTNEPAHWVTPKVIVEVKFNEWTDDGRLRQPVYLGVRDDKDPRTIVREPAAAH